MINTEGNGKKKKVGQILGTIFICLTIALGVAICIALGFKGQEVILTKYEILNPYISNNGIWNSECIMAEVKNEDGSYELKNLGTPKVLYDLSETEKPYFVKNINTLNNTEDELHLPTSYRLSENKK